MILPKRLVRYLTNKYWYSEQDAWWLLWKEIKYRVEHVVLWPWRKIKDSWQNAMRRRYGCKVCENGEWTGAYLSVFNLDWSEGDGVDQEKQEKPKHVFEVPGVEIDMDINSDFLNDVIKGPNEYTATYFHDIGKAGKIYVGEEE